MTREQLTELFKPNDPEYAHEDFDKEQMARSLVPGKPRFIHSAKARNHSCARSFAKRAAAGDTHYDVPNLDVVSGADTSRLELPSPFPGIADVWYSAPAQQINWWLPCIVARGRTMPSL